jgi:hypothetical protein
MAVAASDTTGCGGDANDRVLELAWQTRWFTTAAVKDGTHFASERCIFAGEIHLKRAAPAVKQDRTFKPRPFSVLHVWQRVARDQQIVRALHP